MLNNSKVLFELGKVSSFLCAMRSSTANVAALVQEAKQSLKQLNLKACLLNYVNYLALITPCWLCRLN
jgi:hypothetical protein